MQCLYHMQMMVSFWDINSNFEIIICLQINICFILLVLSCLRNCCYGNCTFGGYKEGYCRDTSSRLPQCKMILWGLGDGQWCTQNAFLDEDPSWSITCIIYNSKRLAPGLSGCHFKRKQTVVRWDFTKTQTYTLGTGWPYQHDQSLLHVWL